MFPFARPIASRSVGRGPPVYPLSLDLVNERALIAEVGYRTKRDLCTSMG